jgi:hypothetical protein
MVRTVVEANTFKPMLERDFQVTRRRMAEDIVGGCMILEMRLACTEQQSFACQMPMSFPVVIEELNSCTRFRGYLIELMPPDSVSVPRRELGGDKQQGIEAEVARGHENQRPQNVYVLNQMDQEDC